MSSKEDEEPGKCRHSNMARSGDDTSNSCRSMTIVSTPLMPEPRNVVTVFFTVISHSALINHVGNFSLLAVNKWAIGFPIDR